MKSLAAIFVGPMEYIGIPPRTPFFCDDCWDVMNDQHETEEIVQLFLTKNQVISYSIIALATIFGGQT